MPLPKVSMIMPCYNSAAFIDDMLDSVINQTYGNVELIAAYDSSTDDTLQKLHAWVPRFEARGYSLLVVENPERLGITGGINKALPHFTGDYLTFPDSDDCMLPEFCETLVGALERDRRFNYASCDNFIADDFDPGKVTVTHAHDKNFKHIDDITLYLLGVIPRAPWRLMVRAAYFREVFPALELYPHPSSHELPFRFPLSRERFLHVEKPLYKYLLHDASYTLSRRKSYHSVIPYYDSMELLANDLIERLEAAGIGFVKPTGGHAVYIDARTVLPDMPVAHYPAWALCNQLYLEGGIRGVEVGSVMFGKRLQDGSETYHSMELVRLAFPRRMYTQSHFDYAAEVIAEVRQKAASIRGVKIIKQPKFLRHFTCECAWV